jgi:multidrug efflux pump subunit AcrB
LKIEEVIYQPDDVSDSVNDFMFNLLIGIFLVIIVGFFGMGYRNAIVVATAIPFSILITFAAMSIFKIYIHQMSLTALIIALGILVDNAIVMSDGIQVNINRGMDNLKASTSAASKASIPVFAATLTTVAAISPLMGMPGSPGNQSLLY